MYEDRLIVFLDIMGFKNIVERSANEPNLVAEIKSLGEFNHNLQVAAYYNAGAPFNGIIPGLQVTVFSDSIVISCPVVPGNLYYFMLLVASHCLAINRQGFFVRGGITFGKLYHNGNVCFGPAMNRAYFLESEMACYPRILIDAVVFGSLNTFRPANNPYEQELQAIHQFSMIDDFYWLQLDYLTPPVLFNNQGEMQIMELNNIREYLVSNLNSNIGNDKIAIKYSWFVDYYNKCVKNSPIMTDMQKSGLYVNPRNI